MRKILMLETEMRHMHKRSWKYYRRTGNLHKRGIFITYSSSLLWCYKDACFDTSYDNIRNIKRFRVLYKRHKGLLEDIRSVHKYHKGEFYYLRYQNFNKLPKKAVYYEN